MAVEALHVDVVAEDIHALVGFVIVGDKLGEGVKAGAVGMKPAEGARGVVPRDVNHLLHVDVVVAAEKREIELVVGA